MSEHERPLKERIWEFTKDISVKVSKKAEKHWKINTLRVEIASIKHRINVKYKELGRYVYESHKAGTTGESSFQDGAGEFYEELKGLEAEIVSREERIELLEQAELAGAEADDTPPPPPPPPAEPEVKEEPAAETDAETEAKEATEEPETKTEEKASTDETK